MAQFDRLLAAMVSNKADALVLEDGDLVKVEIGGQMRPLTKAPLTNAQIIALLKEVASPEAVKHLDAGKPPSPRLLYGIPHQRPAHPAPHPVGVDEQILELEGISPDE